MCAEVFRKCSSARLPRFELSSARVQASAASPHSMLGLSTTCPIVAASPPPAIIYYGSQAVSRTMYCIYTYAPGTWAGDRGQGQETHHVESCQATNVLGAQTRPVSRGHWPPREHFSGLQSRREPGEVLPPGIQCLPLCLHPPPLSSFPLPPGKAPQPNETLLGLQGPVGSGCFGLEGYCVRSRWFPVVRIFHSHSTILVRG